MSKIGDVYEITKDVKGTYYVQLVCVDLPNMNSDVVVVTQKNPLENDIRLKDLLFYTHTIVGLGAREGLWKKIGNKQPSIKISKLAFKNYRDEVVGEAEVAAGLKPEIPFPNWYVWTPADDDFHEVPKDEGFSMKIEEGGIRPPDDIIYRINNGKSGFRQPYEEEYALRIRDKKGLKIGALLRDTVGEFANFMKRFLPKKKVAEPEFVYDQAVIITISFGGPEQFGTTEDRERVYHLEDAMEEVLPDMAGVDGHEFGEGAAIMYVYGPSADDIFAKVEPILKKSAYDKIDITLQYGLAEDPDTVSREFTL